jgi:hypothetical protein
MDVMCYIFRTEKLGSLAIMTDLRHHSLWIIVIGDLSHVHHFLTSFLDLLYITEDGLQVVVDDARDMLIHVTSFGLIVIQSGENVVSRW